MKVALVLILLALVVIPDSEGWGRFRFRVRLPRVRVRKFFKRVFRPVVKVIKPVVRRVIKPVVRKVVKPILQTVEKVVVKPAVEKVKQTLVATADAFESITKEVCKSPEQEQQAGGLPDVREAEDKLQDVWDTSGQRDVQFDDVIVRDEREVEDELEKYAREGRGMEGLESVVRDERDVREIHKLLGDPVRSKRLGKLLGTILCGRLVTPPPEPTPTAA